MQTVSPSTTPEVSLAELYPAETEKMYASCEQAAEKHTGPEKLFGGLSTDIQQYPLQDVDCQIVPADGQPIEFVVEFGNGLSPGISDQSKEYLDRNRKQITAVYEALQDGYNVIVAVPTHDQVHDLALPLGQLCMGLKMEHGYDEPDNRFEIFAKSLAWYDLFGDPVPQLAKMIGHTVFTLPHSRSGDKFATELRDEFNRRALQQMWNQLENGGKILALATGGATNYSIEVDDRFTFTFQAPIHSGTARLMNNERNLTLPVACHLAEDHSYRSTVGNLVNLETEEDCFEIGKWAAREYSELSGNKTFQVPSKENLEVIVRAKAEDIAEAIQSSTFAQWLAEKTRANQKQ